MFYKANEVKLKNNDSYCTDSSGIPITATVLFDDSEESLVEINYVNGKRHGLTKITALDDSFYFETNYANGVEHGESRYYDKGKLCLVKNYKNGVENGPCVQYYPNGNIYHQYMLNDGEPEGLDTYFYESGIIASEVNWSKGEIIGEYRVYYRNGNIWKIHPKKEGLIQYFYPNGNIYKEVPYVDNKCHGEGRWYDDNGSLIATQHYLNGVEHENGKRYTPQGNIDFEMSYDESRKLFYKTFDHCIMLYQLSALTNELIGDPLISFISLPDQTGQQSRLQGYLTSAPDYFQYILSNIMFAPHINLSAWKTKSNVTLKFDNDEPKPLRCKFYNYELTKLLQNFPDEIYRENNIFPRNDLEALGIYAFVNEFNQIGGNDDAFEHKTEVTFQVGRKGNIKFDLSSFEKCKEFYINNLEFLKS